MQTFSEFGLSEELLKGISDLGYVSPSSIQKKVLPILIESDQDIIATAQTGTGKTAAFGLPIIERTRPNENYVQTLILSPTRELCLQIAEDLKNYAKYKKNISIVPIYGGANIETQIKALARGAQIVVATPGRAKDLINRKKLKLNQVERVVLDEADEMLTMGFKDDLDYILSSLPEKRQSLLFSATMSKEVRRISKNYMHDPIEIEAEKVNTGTKNIEHYYYMVPAKQRYEVLKRIVDVNPNIYGIVFCRTRRETQEIATRLVQDGYNADSLHGDMSQAQRDDVMDKFRKGLIQILVATDVAARGLDVNELTHVINYNLPDDTEVYTHRSGRTGRAGNKGISIAILHSKEKSKLRDIEKHSNISFTESTVPTGKEICAKQLFALVDKIEKVKVDEDQIAPFLPDVYKQLEWLDREQLIKHFVSAEFNRFLSYYKNASDIISEKGDERGSRNSRNRDNFKRFFINIGNQNGLTPARLLGVINEALDSKSAEVGQIEILKSFSFFEIEEKEADLIQQNLNGQSFNGTKINVEIAESTGAKKNSSGKTYGKRGNTSFHKGNSKNRRKF